MQDINPIRKTIGVKESQTPDSIDLRASIGVSDINSAVFTPSDEESQIKVVQAAVSTTPILRRKEEAAFSYLYNRQPINSIENQKQDTKPVRSMPPRRKSMRGVYSFLLLSLFVLGFVLYTFVFGSVRVSVTPVRTVLEVNKTITIPVQDIDLGSDILTVVASSSESKDLPRRGVSKVQTKASGKIMVYNAFDTSPQKLITNTRFESKTGKTYRSAESIIVPGIKNGVPGQVDITVYADSVGADYNAEAGEFTIPGFKGTARYAKFTAKSKTKLAGGSSGTTDAAADEDVIVAQNELVSKIKENILVQIKSQDPGEDYIYLADAVLYAQSDNRNELLSDPKTEFKQEVTAKAFFIKKTYLSKKLLEGSNRNEDEGLVLEDSAQIVFGGVKNEAKSSLGDIVFTVTGSPSFISKLDEVTIKSSLSGKSRSEFENSMKYFKGVEKAEPHFNPFWLRSFPNSVARINIEILK